MEERDRVRMTIWRIGTTCWIPKATDTHSEYVILVAFPPQQWLHDRAPMLRLYVHCLCCSCISVANFEFVKVNLLSDPQLNGN
jgi:hypothetical protein